MLWRFMIVQRSTDLVLESVRGFASEAEAAEAGQRYLEKKAEEKKWENCKVETTWIPDEPKNPKELESTTPPNP